jgi:hypothetical protein
MGYETATTRVAEVANSEYEIYLVFGHDFQGKSIRSVFSVTFVVKIF